MFRATETQLGIFLDWSANRRSLRYNVTGYCRLPVGIDDARLERAARETMAAHGVFRTRFAVQDGAVMQDFDGTAEIPFVRVTLADEAAVRAHVVASARPFDLLGGELIRFQLVTTVEAKYLTFDISHAIYDGTTHRILFDEISRRYEGEGEGVGGGVGVGEGATYADFAADEARSFETARYAEAAADHKARFAGVTATAPDDPFVPAGGVAAQGDRLTARATVDRTLVDDACRALDVTPNLFFMGVFARVLSAFSNERRVTFTTVNHGRRDAAFRRTFGACVKMVPVLGELKGDQPLADYLRSFKLHRAGVYPFTHAVRDLGLQQGFSFLYQVGTVESALTIGGERYPLTVMTAGGDSEMPALLLTADGEGGAAHYVASLSCVPGRYSQAFLDAFCALFVSTARNFAARPAACLGEIPTLAPDEIGALTALARGEDLAYDATKTFAALVAERAAEASGRTAVVDADSSLTYAELETRANAVAGELVANGVAPGSFVGLMLPRRNSFIVSLLGVQKCGAGYVPIDPDYPPDRIAYMLADSEANVLVTTRALFAGRTLDFKGKVVFYEDFEAGRSGIAPYQPSPSPSPSSPAYMIYTSGSTGRPKGVVVSQRAVRHLCAWFAADFELSPVSRVATHPSFSFDASVIDIFPALASGAELHIYSEEVRKNLPAIRDYIVAHGITGGTMSTQIGRTLLEVYPDLPLRYLMLGGEKLLPTGKTVARVANGYGPTEFCVCSSYQIVDPAAKGDIPIGRAVPGTSSFVLDRYGQLLPQGFAGELCLAGPQIADGYWHNPEKTAAAFVPNLVQVSSPSPREDDNSLLYRTGDRARYNDAGLLEYLGRIDGQVKLRGFRIEIGEVEHAAASFPGVTSVAAAVRDVAGESHLVLYYAAEAPVDETALRTRMAASLAAYMVPDYFVRLDALPLTPNGKINRAALDGALGDRPLPTSPSTYTEPRAGAEAEIAAAYAETLGRERFSATADFFLSGGTSLLGIKAVVALQKRGLDVQYGDLFKYKTPRDLAAFLSSTSASTSPSATFDYGAYDYAKIDALLAATGGDLFDGFATHPLGTVLLTGATGYLGIHVLRELLQKTSEKIVALVRRKGTATAERRLDSQYVYYFGERLSPALRERIVFVEGEITDPKLLAGRSGIAPYPIQTVINCAAVVKHFVADDAMDRVNVGGVENLIRWCAAARARLVHISTYSVGGTVGVASTACLTERALFVGQDSDNDYVRTKFLAERAVLAAVAEGRIRAKVMRLGNLMGRESDGEFQMNVGSNAFVNALKSYKAIGAFPLEELATRIEMSPIDRVAEAICLLATTPDEMVVFHPFNAYALDMGAVLSALVRRGYAVSWVSRADFAAHVESIRNDAERARELQGVLHYARRHLADQKMTPVDNAWTTTVLYRLGFHWKPAEDRYLANFFDMLDGLAVFG